MNVHRNKFLYNKTNRRTNFQIYSGTKTHMFRAEELPETCGFSYQIKFGN